MARKDRRIEVWRVERGWLRRVIFLSGGAEVTIEYDGSALGIGGDDEVVLVNGTFASMHRQGDRYGHHSLEFRFSARGGNAVGVLEVRLTPFPVFTLAALRLRIDETLVYEEVMGRVRLGNRTSDLPLPGGPPATDAGDLPLPGEPQD